MIEMENFYIKVFLKIVQEIGNSIGVMEKFQNAILFGCFRGHVIERPAIHNNLASWRRNGAAAGLDQRRFAGAVLTDQRVNFAAFYIQRNIVQCRDTGVELRDGVAKRSGDCRSREIGRASCRERV